MERALVYGATGYTGEIVAERAAADGDRPVLAARSEGKLRPLAERLELPHRTFGLDDPKAIDAALEGIDVVLHCAGPFSKTSAPMAEACLRTKTHYLDITGEIAVYEAMVARDDAAKSAGIMMMSGVGFDIVPTDCLAVHLARQLEDATHLTLAFAGSAKPSRGTTLTTLESIGEGGAVRRDGVIESVPAAWKTRSIDFGDKTRTCVTIPWGDVSTAFHSTGIPNIEVFMAAPPGLRRFMKLSRYIGGLLSSGPVQRFLASRVPEGGPDSQARQSGQMRVWGEVCNADGRSVEARLVTPEGYQFTMLSSLLITRRVLAGDAPVGFQTPAMAYGPDLVLEVEGVSRR